MIKENLQCGKTWKAIMLLENSNDVFQYIVIIHQIHTEIYLHILLEYCIWLTKRKTSDIVNLHDAVVVQKNLFGWNS